MSIMNEEKLEKTWNFLEHKAAQERYTDQRIYQRLDLEKETGIRLGIILPHNIREILIQLTKNDQTVFSPPKWEGMGFEIILMDVPEKETRHIRLYLNQKENSRVFTTVCTDIIKNLMGVSKPEHRSVQLISILEKWSRFFHKHGTKGLSNEAQRGLYGELFLLNQLLDSGMDTLESVQSWLGCRRRYHDYEHKGIIIEVKTTISKEPRKVRINNERQLDDRGFDGMYLYALSLNPSQTSGQKLPELINEISIRISDDVAASDVFGQSIKAAGYIKAHESHYNMGYIVKHEDIFRVQDGFPRLIVIPSGTGDLSYTVSISSCKEFLEDLDIAINYFMKGKIND